MTIAHHLAIPSPGQLWEQYVYPPADFSPLLLIPGRPDTQIVVSGYHACPQRDSGRSRRRPDVITGRAGRSVPGQRTFCPRHWLLSAHPTTRSMKGETKYEASPQTKSSRRRFLGS